MQILTDSTEHKFLIDALTALGTLLAAVAAFVAVWVAYHVHAAEKRLAQRQLIIPLWQYTSVLSEIRPDRPVTPDVIKSVNTLELVALCIEGGMVDEQVIRRTFRNSFLEQYRNIRGCKILPGMDNTTGEDLLRRSLAATSFYHTLEKEDEDKDRLQQ